MFRGKDHLQYNTIQYNTIQYNTIQYNTIQYNTIQYNTIQYNTIQYNTIYPRWNLQYIYIFKHAKINKRIRSTGLQDCRVGVHLNYYSTCLQLSGTEQTIGAFLYFREGYSTVLLHCTESFASDN